MDERGFLCPFCGAPIREMIPVGTTQVKCRYCGGTVLTAPFLGSSYHFSGVLGQCPNHLDTPPVGSCTSCDQAFCSRCLHIVVGLEGKHYYCPKCTQISLDERRTLGKCVGGMGIILIAFGVLLSATGAAGAAGLGLAIVLIGVCLLLTGPYEILHLPSWPTIHDEQQVRGGCPFCGTFYFYKQGAMSRDGLVKCQNCGKAFPLAASVTPED